MSTETKVKKGKSPKCKQCLEWVDKSLDDFTFKSGRYFHNSCMAQIESDTEHYKSLVDYVIALYQVSAPTGWMFKQIKEYKDKRGYTYIGMEYTLRFMYEVENVHLLEAKDSGLGLIPFYYEKAKYYYANMAEIKASLRDVKIDNTPEICYVDRPSKKRRNKKINIEDL